MHVDESMISGWGKIAGVNDRKKVVDGVAAIMIMAAMLTKIIKLSQHHQELPGNPNLLNISGLNITSLSLYLPNSITFTRSLKLNFSHSKLLY